MIEWVALHLYLKYDIQMQESKGLTYIRPTDIMKDWHWKYMVDAVHSGVHKVIIPNPIKSHSSVSRAYWAIFDPLTRKSKKAEEKHRRLVENQEVVTYLEKEFKHILKPPERNSVRTVADPDVLQYTDERGSFKRLRR